MPQPWGMTKTALPVLQFQSRWGFNCEGGMITTPALPALEASCDSEPAVSLMEAVSIRFMYPCQAKGSSNWSSEKMWKVCVQPRKVARNMTMSYYVPFQKSSQWGFCDEMQVGDGSCLVLSWWSTLQARTVLQSLQNAIGRQGPISSRTSDKTTLAIFGTNKSWILNLYNHV